MKKSGFAVKITAFIEADPNNLIAMMEAANKVDGAIALIKNAGFIQVYKKYRLMLYREAPDEPKSVQAGFVGIPPTASAMYREIVERQDRETAESMPPIPAHLKR